MSETLFDMVVRRLSASSVSHDSIRAVIYALGLDPAQDAKCYRILLPEFLVTLEDIHE